MTITDTIENLYMPAVDAGMDIDIFWNSTIQEITDYMDSRLRIRAQDRKERIINLFLLANLCAERDPMTDKKQIEMTMPWDWYPELFQEEKRQYQLQAEQEKMEEYKERRKRYVQEFNAKRKM